MTAKEVLLQRTEGIEYTVHGERGKVIFLGYLLCVRRGASQQFQVFLLYFIRHLEEYYCEAHHDSCFHLWAKLFTTYNLSSLLFIKVKYKMLEIVASPTTGTRVAYLFSLSKLLRFSLPRQDDCIMPHPPPPLKNNLYFFKTEPKQGLRWKQGNPLFPHVASPWTCLIINYISQYALFRLWPIITFHIILSVIMTYIVLKNVWKYILLLLFL